jgi:hypothetical protein
MKEGVPLGDEDGSAERDLKSVDVRTESKDVENAAERTEASPPMTFKRFMVLLSLIWLVVTSATPILFITATLCNSSKIESNYSSLYSCRHWRSKVTRVDGNS